LLVIFSVNQIDVSQLGLKQTEESIQGIQVGSSASKSGSSKQIKQISILGERNSGTRWTYS
jgi:hypothetical protein